MSSWAKIIKGKNATPSIAKPKNNGFGTGKEQFEALTMNMTADNGFVRSEVGRINLSEGRGGRFDALFCYTEQQKGKQIVYKFRVKKCRLRQDTDINRKKGIVGKMYVKYDVPLTRNEAVNIAGYIVDVLDEDERVAIAAEIISGLGQNARSKVTALLAIRQ